MIKGTWSAVWLPPHGGLRPFHQKSTCLSQLPQGPYVVQSWSRTPRVLGIETRGGGERHEEHVPVKSLDTLSLSRSNRAFVSASGVEGSVQGVGNPPRGKHRDGAASARMASRDLEQEETVMSGIRTWLEPFFRGSPENFSSSSLLARQR